MVYTSAKRGLPGGNPLTNALLVVVGMLVVAASVVLGFVAFVILAALVTMMAAVIGIRLWWFGRRVRKAAQSGETGAGTIEGEFVVITREERSDRD